MNNIVNLRNFRKRARRQQAAETATEQRLKHGVSKAQRSLAQSRVDKSYRDLEQHRIETGEGQ
jgi:hypothetical protein